MQARQNGGTWHLIECGVDHLEQTVEEGTAEGSSLPGDDIEFAIITFLETRAGGKYDTVCLGSTNIFFLFSFLCLIWHVTKRYG